jgi:hypothetical protein
MADFWGHAAGDFFRRNRKTERRSLYRARAAVLSTLVSRQITPSSHRMRIRTKIPPRPIYIYASQFLVVAETTGKAGDRSNRYGRSPNLSSGNILPVGKVPDLLDFPLIGSN